MEPMILLVDDEPAVLAVLRRVMHDLAGSYDLVAVPDGATALARLAERPAVLVITDQRMPDMDGVALIEAIRVLTPQCPVILMTGYPSSDIEQRAGAAGADFFLSKPFRVVELATMVRAVLA
jgi:CheY-like chemotaxis protein